MYMFLFSSTCIVYISPLSSPCILACHDLYVICINIVNVHRYIFKRTHIYRGLDTKHIKENKAIYKNIIRRTKTH